MEPAPAPAPVTLLPDAITPVEPPTPADAAHVEDALDFDPDDFAPPPAVRPESTGVHALQAAAEALADADEDGDDDDELALSDDDSDEGGPDLARDDAADVPGEVVQVSFEHRRKADKIFEQAEADAAAGNLSSARMNAKLAMIYDPNNARFKALFEQWSTAAEAIKKDTVSREVALFQESKTLEMRGDYRGAVAALKEAVQIAPRAAPLYNRLGVLQATRLKDYRAASDNLLKACELAPGNLSFKNNLGKVLGMAEGQREGGGKPKEKRSWFKRADDDEAVVRVKKLRPKV